MKKKAILTVLVIIIVLFGVGIYGYVSADRYLEGKFAPNTWVEDIYCTGKTPWEVNQELMDRMVVPTLMVNEESGKWHSFPLSKAGYSCDYLDCLMKAQKEQSIAGWMGFLKDEYIIDPGEPEISYDRTKLEEWWNELPFVKKEEEPTVFRIVLTEKGYVLENTLEHHLDSGKTLENVIKSIDQKIYKVAVKDCGVFYDYPMDDEQKKIYENWKELDEKQQCGLTYDMGAEKIAFDPGLMSRFIAKDESGAPLYHEDGTAYYDKDRVEEFLQKLYDDYHTYGERQFKSSRGDVVLVKPTTYGTEINLKKEKTFLWDYLNNEELRHTETDHIPEYLHQTPVRGLDDIGGTYIEVDMTEQKIYFYMNYKLAISSDVVTGNLKTRHGTPSGVYAIQKKITDTKLTGPGYSSHVDYWMPFVRSIGLHDANWRDEFGGEIYKRNGSHGCVNLPDETAVFLYENAEIGTPVILYY
ncbi:MAG: L,D-transpeptidase [Lachnospiraceae bacterium]|nr:L,D-transpeptidase [Lachnospiraceae bacterium]